MRKIVKNDALSVNAIAGSYVVLLGINLTKTAGKGVLGFAIERIDHTENERYWLKGLKTFEETDPDRFVSIPMSTLEHPVQSFQWGDYTAKPHHDYTYRIVAMMGKPKNLVQGTTVEVQMQTENEEVGTHSVYFNRGVAGSQAYANKFKNLPPDQVPDHKALDWLSRGLVEAMLAFIAQAKGKRYSLRAALYEFQYQPVLAAFKSAHDTDADVKIVFDARPNSQDYPDKANRAAIEAAGIADLTIPRTASPSFISHNKFIVLLDKGKPIQVWTGSTNITEGGIFGHSNLGHIVRDESIAASYFAYWEQLSADPEAAKLRPWNDKNTPTPKAEPKPNSIATVFSPRSSVDALQWYADRMAATNSAVFFTAAFGANKLFQSVLEKDGNFLRYMLLEKTDGSVDVLKRNPENYISVGAIDDQPLGHYLQERLTGLNDHVKYIHTKYMLVDPLSDNPLVISGSANFSDASTKNNDENMLVIQGDTRVADIYLCEFMRLFNHFYTRDLMNQKVGNSDSTQPDQMTMPTTTSKPKKSGDKTAEKPIAKTPDSTITSSSPAISKSSGGSIYLVPDDSWQDEYFKSDSPKQKERLYFAGK